MTMRRSTVTRVVEDACRTQVVIGNASGSGRGRACAVARAARSARAALVQQDTPIALRLSTRHCLGPNSPIAGPAGVLSGFPQVVLKVQCGTADILVHSPRRRSGRVVRDPCQRRGQGHAPHAPSPPESARGLWEASACPCPCPCRHWRVRRTSSSLEDTLARGLSAEADRARICCVECECDRREEGLEARGQSRG
jgi:hypothetical protein